MIVLKTVAANIRNNSALCFKTVLLYFIICLFGYQLFANNDSNDIELKHTFGIKGAWQRVLSINESIRLEMLNTQKAKNLKLEAKLSFLPEVNLSAIYIHLDKPSTIDLIQDRAGFNQIQAGIGNNPPLSNILNIIGTPITILKQDSIFSALNIIYPLYTGNKRLMGAKIANVLAKDSHEALRLRELATFEELVGIYYAVILNKEILHSCMEIEQSAYIHYENAKKLNKLGQIARLELLAAESGLDKAKNATLAAKNALEISQLALDSILGSNQAIPISSLSFQTYILKNEQHYIDMTMQNYPALKIAANGRQIADYKRYIAFGNFMPKIAAFGSYMVTSSDQRFRQIMPNWLIGLNASWSIISPKGKFPQYQIAKIEQIHADTMESKAIKDMQLLIKKSYKQAIFKHEERENLASSIMLARENVRLQEKAFLQGISTSNEVNDARNALLSILVEQQRLAYEEIIYLAKLMALSGEIDEFFNIVEKY
ncbi:TolC family protein [Helicobacter muridarum]|uniref:Outer membrane efflux protein n=1 Tax=Helicobacter muridarum TaxID=216 RepID=A0A377PSF8_9HELI|nr:TolC family protein [Helicobacter muridarum]TLD98577.1 TolC family protein [Helicobacter muridarum]STQ85537.1 outer membrane efflux protein [Helicobacter muridarum]